MKTVILIVINLIFVVGAEAKKAKNDPCISAFQKIKDGDVASFAVAKCPNRRL